MSIMLHMKKILSVSIAVMLCAVLAISASAARDKLPDPDVDARYGGGTTSTTVNTCDGMPIIPETRLGELLVDDADLLTDAQEAALLAKLNELSERQKFELVIVTVDGLNGATPRNFADDYFDYNGYGYGPDDDGALFLISPEERDWWFSTHAFGIKAFTDAGIDQMMGYVTPALKDDKYDKAFNELVKQCDKYLTQARTGEPYDTGNLPPPGMKNPMTNVLISIAIGAVVAFFVLSIMKKSLKSVRMQAKADTYLRQNSLIIANGYEQFLYSNVSRVARQSSSGGGGGGSSSHSSSSGRSHGGGGGKY